MNNANRKSFSPLFLSLTPRVALIDSQIYCHINEHMQVDSCQLAKVPICIPMPLTHCSR